MKSPPEAKRLLEQAIGVAHGNAPSSAGAYVGADEGAKAVALLSLYCSETGIHLTDPPNIPNAALFRETDPFAPLLAVSPPEQRFPCLNELPEVLSDRVSGFVQTNCAVTLQPIQLEAIVLALKGHHVFCSAPCGSGKSFIALALVAYLRDLQPFFQVVLWQIPFNATISSLVRGVFT